jgi:pilus assembly protein Flp/PilA
MAQLILKFLANESGQTSIEYGVIASVISVGILAAVTSIGSSVSGKFQKVATNMT